MYVSLENQTVQVFKGAVLDHDQQQTARDKYEGDGQFRQVFFGRLVCSRVLIHRLTVTYVNYPSA